MQYSRLRSILKFIFFTTLLCIATTVSAYEERFTLESNKDGAYLSLDLPVGHKIFSNVAGDSGLPITISFDGSKNLANYKVMWPQSSRMEHMQSVDYIFTGKVIIPLFVEAIDPNEKIDLKIAMNYVLCGDQCVPVKQEIQGVTTQSSRYKAKEPEIILLTLLAAMLGGFILNFMPCVLPVLALKLMSVIKSGASYRSTFIAIALGIMSTFWALAAASLIIKGMGKQVGIGLGFQEPEFIIFVCVLITIFISLALGRIQINMNLPSWGMANNFITGVMATLLSVPCTAPFLGGATLVAVTGTNFESFLIFTFMGLGFSLPYLLLIINPNLLQFLPKSGPWMESIKKILVVLFVATLVWLLEILYIQLGLRATIGVFLLLLLIKFALEQTGLKYRIILLAIITYTITYLPQLAHKEDEAFEAYAEHVWHDFDAAKINELVGHGYVVVVDVTADWCLTCKFNKLRLWDRSKTISLLSSPNIIAMRADVTMQNKFVEEFLKGRGVYGIPFDIVYGSSAPKGITLPTMPSYDDLKQAIDKVR